MLESIGQSGSRSFSKTAGPADGKERSDSPRQALLRARERILDEVLRISRPAPAGAPEASGDEADRAREESSRNLSLLLTARGHQKLRILEEALEKVEAGTYGICEECDEPIGAGRLKAMPLARLCVACQAAREKEPAAPPPRERILFPEEEG